MAWFLWVELVLPREMVVERVLHFVQVKWSLCPEVGDSWVQVLVEPNESIQICFLRRVLQTIHHRHCWQILVHCLAEHSSLCRVLQSLDCWVSVVRFQWIQQVRCPWVQGLYRMGIWDCSMLLGQCRQFLVGSEYANPWISFSLLRLWESKSFLKRSSF